MTSEEEGKTQSGYRKIKKSDRTSISIQRSGKSVGKKMSTEIKKSEQTGQDSNRLTLDETSEEGAVSAFIL
jgi:hypothetical protein